ncbi:MAG: TGS domain-containing protein, partial [Candidatus Kapaibacteriota bacterium]
FTPKGDLRILPKGATPIDFAFDIHSQVGARCIGAKVNGKIVPLDHALSTGDQVEILTSRNQSPHRDWIRIAVTHKARTHIRRILNEQRSDTPAPPPPRQRGVRSATPPSSPAPSPAAAPSTIPLAAVMRDQGDGVTIVGDESPTGKVMFSYARCCNPVPGDDIIGIVTIGSGIKVHRLGCQNVRALEDRLKERLIPLEWSPTARGVFLASIKITGDDRAGMLNDITSAVISVANTNIRGVNIDAFDSIFEGILSVYVRDTAHVEAIFDKLRHIRGVRTVERFSE